ncbi:hypothetical protein OG984_21310 [Nocardioides sp. NBC_00368]|uniref:hypothetical protein n=1 Tax=Nocardioides sp. NBC_00368 TaxID=2976000 RepID=UPI002E1E52C3
MASSVLVLAGVLTGLVLVSPPAHAALSVTIYASASTVPEGSTVTFTGRAIDARLGSVVRLQRQRTDGSWALVSSRKLVDTRRYRFATTPPRGYQKYRVVKPAQLGQPGRVSATKTIKVTWRPGVTLGTVKHRVVDYSTGAVTTSTNGRTTRLSAGFELRRELQRSDGTWALHGRVRIASDQTWRDRFSSRHGQRFRYVAPASGSRLAKASSSFVVDGHWTPTITAFAALVPHTGNASLRGDSTGLPSDGWVRLQVLYSDGWQFVDTGSAVAADGTFAMTFQPNMSFSYRVYAPSDGLRRAATSAPFQVAEGSSARVELNTTTPVVFPSRATQRQLVVALEKGQTFTYYSWYVVKESVTDPSGNTVPTLGPSDHGTTRVAPLTGDYIITLTTAGFSDAESVDITLSTPLVIDSAIDAPAIDLANQLPGQVVDLRFDGTAGSTISEFTSQSPRRSTEMLLDPTGNSIAQWHLGYYQRVWRLEETGTYTLRFAPNASARFTRPNERVLSTRTGAMILDGSPASINLDVPGRLGIVTVDAPSGAEIHVTHTGDAHLNQTLIDPDDRTVSDTSVGSTRSGTYSLLVFQTPTAGETPPAVNVDFYASTPLAVDATSEGVTSFDRGPAPARPVDIKVPVSAGQLLSLEVLDNAGEFCTGDAGVRSSTDPIDWMIRGRQLPSVFHTATAGDSVLRVTPCSATGSIRFNAVSPVTPTLTSSTVDQWGMTTDVHEVAVTATQPGQVMVVDYDAESLSGRLDMSATSSTFPNATAFMTGRGDPWSNTPGAEWRANSWDQIWAGDSFYSRRSYFLVYAGPKETGSLDLEFTFVHK